MVLELLSPAHYHDLVMGTIQTTLYSDHASSQPVLIYSREAIQFIQVIKINTSLVASIFSWSVTGGIKSSNNSSLSVLSNSSLLCELFYSLKNKHLCFIDNSPRRCLARFFFFIQYLLFIHINLILVRRKFLQVVIWMMTSIFSMVITAIEITMPIRNIKTKLTKKQLLSFTFVLCYANRPKSLLRIQLQEDLCFFWQLLELELLLCGVHVTLWVLQHLHLGITAGASLDQQAAHPSSQWWTLHNRLVFLVQHSYCCFPKQQITYT